MIAAKNAKVAKVDWKTVKLGEVCDIKTGKLNSCAATENGRYPFFTCAENPLRIDTPAYNSESVLVAGNCTPYVNYYKGKFNAYQRTYIITPKSDDILGRWLYFWMRRQIQYMIHRQQGSVEKYFVIADFTEEEIYLHPLPTQRKIAAVLGALDDKIENNRKICANLEAQAQALFKSWFVDFEPFGGRGFQDSEIGKIPIGWKVFKLGDFLQIKTGKKDANVATSQGKYPFFSCSQNVLWTDEYSFDGRAILVAGNGDFNVKRCDGKFEAYQRTYVLIPYKDFLAGWLYYVVKYNLEKITMSAQGSVIKFITKGHLEEFKFAAPSIIGERENDDTRIFNKINSVIDSRIEENYRLAELRDTLLPKLMSGELDVDDVEV